MTVPHARDKFLFGFGSAGSGIPVLAGADHETLFGGLAPAGQENGFELFASADWLVGVRLEPVAADIGVRTDAVYADLLKLTRRHGREPVRIWNYVPDINAQSPDGLEVYRGFCLGRARAFDRAGWTGALPAASAVGGAPGVLVVMFAAARKRPQASENPEQVPAYEYPSDYGPRAPSFSRAMQVDADGRRWTFVSGTAAIKGHASLAPGDLGAQIACTLDNLRLISLACGLGERLGEGTAGERHFKVYLRDARELPAAQTALEGALMLPGDRVTWLHADICRAELLIEIEVTVVE